MDLRHFRGAKLEYIYSDIAKICWEEPVADARVSQVAKKIKFKFDKILNEVDDYWWGNA